MSEDFVDVHWRGLEVARKARLKPDGRGVGQLEHGTPMPIGTALTVRTADGLELTEIAPGVDLQKDILDKAVKAVGFLPNMYANMVNAPAVLSTYLHGYGLFRNESGLKPAEQEVVFLAVSQVNGCTYCTAAHSMIADKKSGVSADVQIGRAHV